MEGEPAESCGAVLPQSCANPTPNAETERGWERPQLGSSQQADRRHLARRGVELEPRGAGEVSRVSKGGGGEATRNWLLGAQHPILSSGDGHEEAGRGDGHFRSPAPQYPAKRWGGLSGLLP